MINEETKNQIANAETTLANHQSSIQLNTDAIANNLIAINNNLNSITLNGQNIQAVTDSYNKFRSTQVAFYGETVCCQVTVFLSLMNIFYFNAFFGFYVQYTSVKNYLETKYLNKFVIVIICISLFTYRALTNGLKTAKLLLNKTDCLTPTMQWTEAHSRRVFMLVYYFK